MDVLEDRCVPANIIVTTLADTVAVDGAVSLREAIQSVNAAASINADVAAVGAYGTSDTINFTGLSGTITLASNLDAVSKSVVIEGNVTAGLNPTITVDGGLQFTTFVITGPRVTIARLAIVRSSLHGIEIIGAAATGALIRGNHIGIDAAGTTAAGNRTSGISIREGATGAVIGGILGQDSNVISGNDTPPSGVAPSAANAIAITGIGTNNHTVVGNLIGTDATGTRAVSNRTGIAITQGASNNTIGGTSASARNIISGNRGGGLAIDSLASNGNLIQGNFIGTDITGGLPLGNALGVFISGSNSGNRIGGTAAGAGNRIAFNRTQGVWVTSSINGNPQGTQILENRISQNGTLGIDLGTRGVTANDAQDADSGANGLQNYPVITSAVGNQVFGNLNSAPNTTFRLEFFASDARDPSGFGEGQTFLGSIDVTTDASGNAPFTFTTAGPLSTFVTATATNQTTSETSEFSNAVLGIATPPLILPLTPPLVPPLVPPLLPQSVPVLNTPLVAPGMTPTVTAGNLAPTIGARQALNAKAVLAVAQGPGGDGIVRIFNPDGSLRAEAPVFTGFQGGVRIGTADVNGDGIFDGIAGAGIGGLGGHVKVFDGNTGAEIRSFLAFEGFVGGVFVAGGDLNADGFAEIIVGAGEGGPGGHVKVFDGQTNSLLASFLAFDPGFLGGATVGASDFNNDGLADLITGAGPGAGPHVKVIEGTSLQQVLPNGKIADSALLASFFAYGLGFTGGVFVTADGDFNNDGVVDLITGAGPGAGPHVKALSGTQLMQTNASGEISDAAALASFFAFEEAFRGGVRVGEADVDQDGDDEILFGAGSGAGPDVRILQNLDPASQTFFFAFAPTFSGGVFVD